MSLTNSKFLDSLGLGRVWGKVTTALATKVDKVEGKGLSTEDYTTAEKTKLSGIETGAQVNVVEGVSVNGTDLTPDANKGVAITIPVTEVQVNGVALVPSNHAVDIAVPTNNNQLTNGAGYQTASDVSTAITAALAGITSFEFEVVNTLPQEGEVGVIYLIANSGAGSNVYDEYIWISTDGGTTYQFELLGQKELDLTNYWNGTNLVALTDNEIDTICS